jgi:transposase InsO family protein
LVLAAKRAREEMQQETEALGKRVAELYKQLSYPGAAKFQAALRKRGIKFSDAAVRELVAEQGGRQLFAPPARAVGRVTARHVDERWAADVMDFQAKENKSGEVYILVVQDIFSRFLWARALTSKTQVGTAFLRLMEDTNRTPKELNSDGASEFTSQAFQRMLYFNGDIKHRVKEGPQDLATLDRAIGTLRATLVRRVAQGGSWAEELQAAVDSMNQTDHKALYEREPGEVKGDKDLRFNLRYKNAELASENAELAHKRGEALEEKGAFRTLLKPLTGFKRRAGQQNWSEELHNVAEVKHARVTDTDGNSYPMSLVKAVPAASTQVAAPTLAKGGSVKTDEKRRGMLRGYLPQLLAFIRRAGEDGLTIHRASKQMGAVQGFSEDLKKARATLPQMVALFPELRVDRRKGHQVLHVSDSAPPPRAGTLDAFAS